MATFLLFAGAARGAGEFDTGGFNEFKVRGSNGYTIVVLASSRQGFRHGQVLILVSRRGRFVAYLAPALVTDTRIDADLGRLGRIALHFEPSGKQERTAPACQPNSKQAYEAGDYVGEFAFRGEEGFTRVVANRFHFSLHPLLDLICGGPGTSETFGPGLPGARLTARGQVGKAKVDLRVIENRPGALVNVEASLWERSGRVRIQRVLEGSFAARAFSFDADLRTAVLHPPAPFAGAAVFRRTAAKPNRWRGSLTVDFPGRSNVNLTGRNFNAHLVHARLTREGTFYPERPARPNLPPWPSTNPLPTASAMSWLLAPR